MKLIIDIFKGILSKLIFFAIIAAIALYGWNWYKSKRESRSFIVSFDNVDGLTKGAPIYSNGIKIGKVIRIFPLGNSNDIGVKGFVTDKDFPVPKVGVKAKIITDIESGGGKILEVSNMIANEHIGQDLFFTGKPTATKGENPYIIRNTMRIMRDFSQLTKDWANDLYTTLSSQEVQEYKEQMGNTIQNTVTSLEYGTVKEDLRRGIDDLNQDIKDFESKPNRGLTIKRQIDNKAQALKNTINTYGNLADVYK